MWVRISAFAVWALVAATLVFWALRLFTSAPAAPAHTVSVATAVVARADLSRLFGAPAVAAAAAAADPEISSRFRLVGVMAPKSAARLEATGQGIALIAVDGKPARPFRVGATLDTGLVLQAVSLRSASIGPAEGAAALKLEIPPLPPPATGSLPALSFTSENQGGSTAPAAPTPGLVPPPIVNSAKPLAASAEPGFAPPATVAAPPVQPPPQVMVVPPSALPVPADNAGPTPSLVPPPPDGSNKPPVQRRDFGNAQR